MGGPRNEIAWRWEGSAFRATNCRWEKIGVPGRNQYDGITSTHSARATGRGHWRRCTGNSTHPESEAANRFARRLEFAQAGNSSPACTSKTHEGRGLPGSGARNRGIPAQRPTPNAQRNHAKRSAHHQVLAERWRALHYPAERSHTRSRDGRTKCRHLSDANLRRAYDRNALANS